jgi:hypothetical protein
MKTHPIKLHTLALLALSITTAIAKMPAPAAGEESGPRVQLALLLDTSGSMEGLIDQARSQIWQVVNTFISARKDGSTPVVEVALYEYGNSGLSAESKYLRQIQPLTRDLDAVSESLFALKTNGGEEYCGAVIDHATKNLAWDSSPDTYKAIFIAGNEPFNQGAVPPEAACRSAIAKAIVVNTIHCGTEQEGASTGWKDGAKLADGRFLIIDHNQAVISIDAPQDAEIAKLNQELNGTYVAYGADGESKRGRQLAQDALVSQTSASSAVARAATKASGNYKNADWDLVDAVREEKVKPGDLPREELPAELRSLSKDELSAAIERKGRERADLQARILQLNKDREAFVATEKEKQAASGSAKATLDSAMIAAVQEQAAKKGIVFEGK